MLIGGIHRGTAWGSDTPTLFFLNTESRLKILLKDVYFRNNTGKHFTNLTTETLQYSDVTPVSKAGRKLEGNKRLDISYALIFTASAKRLCLKQRLLGGRERGPGAPYTQRWLVALNYE
jgi:hypothetical protein